MQYCTRCLYPETKPDLHFDEEGICSACRNFETRQEIDWASRRNDFIGILDRYRSSDKTNYDCIVPVSGGKDSTYQLIKLLEVGANPLCVTATTDSLSDIGRRNIENLKNIGVDYIEVTLNPGVRRQINRLSLIEVGDISWPEHVSIFTVPVRIAVQFEIPLIVWGENPQNEYGGPAASTQSNILNRKWLEEFGGLLGMRVRDLADHAGIDPRYLIQYSYPKDEDLQRVGVTGVFLGHYFPWDGLSNVILAQAHGFETFPSIIEGSFCNYENLDNYQAGIHDYFKYLKFGFGRATDIACNHIRRGRLSRADAIRGIKQHDGRYPSTYLGRPLAEILAEIKMTVAEFDEICDRFTNKRLFACNTQGRPARDENGFLTLINGPI